ncbi:MAG: cation transporter, partial [Terriglobales bacterium]
AESAVCAYLSWIALIGVGINGVWHVRMADPAAALAVVPIILYEGREALRGRPCGCGACGI